MQVQSESCASGFCPHCGTTLAAFSCVNDLCTEKRRIRKAIKEAKHGARHGER